MAEQTKPGKEIDKRPAGEVDKPPLNPQTLQMFAQMVTMIPSDDGDGASRIVEQILSAASWEDLNEPWQSKKAKENLGKLLRFDEIKRLDSDYADGLGIYLYVTATDTRTGEDVSFPSGSIPVVAQLVRGYVLGAFPLFGTLVEAARPTKQGYKPQHIVFEGSGAGQE